MDVLQHAGLGALVITFLGGILSFFSPCVAPLVPGYISYLSGAALREDELASIAPSRTSCTVSRPTQRVRMLRFQARTVQARRASLVAHPADGTLALPHRLSVTSRVSLLFVGGFSLAFIALGVLAGSFGQLLAAYRPVMETLAGIVMLAMGAFLLNLLPRAWMDTLMREGRLHPKPGMLRGWGLAAPFLFGVVFAAGWTPCIGPVLAAILAYASASGSSSVAVTLLAVYSLGFAVPFLAVGLGWSAGLRTLGWLKRYGNVISKVSGGALIAVSLLYLTGQVSIFSTWAGRLALPVIH